MLLSVAQREVVLYYLDWTGNGSAEAELTRGDLTFRG